MAPDCFLGALGRHQGRSRVGGGASTDEGGGSEGGAASDTRAHPLMAGGAGGLGWGIDGSCELNFGGSLRGLATPPISLMTLVPGIGDLETVKANPIRFVLPDRFLGPPGRGMEAHNFGCHIPKSI